MYSSYFEIYQEKINLTRKITTYHFYWKNIVLEEKNIMALFYGIAARMGKTKPLQFRHVYLCVAFHRLIIKRAFSQALIVKPVVRKLKKNLITAKFS